MVRNENESMSCVRFIAALTAATTKTVAITQHRRICCVSHYTQIDILLLFLSCFVVTIFIVFYLFNSHENNGMFIVVFASILVSESEYLSNSNIVVCLVFQFADYC